MTYTVIVTLTAKLGCESELKRLLNDACELSRNEPTCITHRLHQDLNDSNKLILYEQWESKAAHELQFTKPYIISLGEKIPDLLASPYQITFAEALSI